jgi:hypothetical protein
MSQGIPLGNKTIPDPFYSDSRIHVYGVKREKLRGPGFDWQITSKSDDGTDLELALIYGYDYQGHCYRLDTPKLFMVQAQTRLPASGCNFEGDFWHRDPSFPNVPVIVRYSMWEVDKLDQTLQLDLKQGFFDALILDANLPTGKQPASYRIATAVGHRSGKLTDN